MIPTFLPMPHPSQMPFCILPGTRSHDVPFYLQLKSDASRQSIRPRPAKTGRTFEAPASGGHSHPRPYPQSNNTHHILHRSHKTRRSRSSFFPHLKYCTKKAPQMRSFSFPVIPSLCSCIHYTSHSPAGFLSFPARLRSPSRSQASHQR